MHHQTSEQKGSILLWSTTIHEQCLECRYLPRLLERQAIHQHRDAISKRANTKMTKGPLTPASESFHTRSTFHPLALAILSNPKSASTSAFVGLWWEKKQSSAGVLSDDGLERSTSGVGMAEEVDGGKLFDDGGARRARQLSSKAAC